MVAIIVLASLISVSGLISFLSSYQTKRRLQSGRGSEEDLADYVGIWDRDALLRLSGVSEDAEGQLKFDPEYLNRLPQSPLKRLFDDPLIDLLCALAGLVVIGLTTREIKFLWVPLLVVGALQAAGWIWAAREALRWH